VRNTVQMHDYCFVLTRTCGKRNW